MIIEDIFDLPKTSPTVLEALPADVLMSLQERAVAHMSEASKFVAILHDTLAQRYARSINSTGTHHVHDGGIDVTVNIPKKVKWDQAQLKAAVEKIATEWKENPEDYVDIDVKVSESKYNAWPPAIRDLFTPARTVETGKPTFKLALAKQEAA